MPTLVCSDRFPLSELLAMLWIQGIRAGLLGFSPLTWTCLWSGDFALWLRGCLGAGAGGRWLACCCEVASAMISGISLYDQQAWSVCVGHV